MHLLPNGVDLVRFASAAPTELPEADGRILVGFVGSRKAWHGVMDLLEAFARVARSTEEPSSSSSATDQNSKRPASTGARPISAVAC